MSVVWALLHIVATILVIDLWLTLLIFGEVKIRQFMRRRRGLCDDYTIEGFRRHIVFCQRQTPNHNVHVCATHTLQAHAEDARLREQGL